MRPRTGKNREEKEKSIVRKKRQKRSDQKKNPGGGKKKGRGMFLERRLLSLTDERVSAKK